MQWHWGIFFSKINTRSSLKFMFGFVVADEKKNWDETKKKTDDDERKGNQWLPYSFFSIQVLINSANDFKSDEMASRELVSNAATSLDFPDTWVCTFCIEFHGEINRFTRMKLKLNKSLLLQIAADVAHEMETIFLTSDLLALRWQKASSSGAFVELGPLALHSIIASEIPSMFSLWISSFNPNEPHWRFVDFSAPCCSYAETQQTRLFFNSFACKSLFWRFISPRTAPFYRFCFITDRFTRFECDFANI
jgi:hypothetical protein